MFVLCTCVRIFLYTVAMLGVAGILAQELINGKEIFVNLGLAKDSFDPASLPVQF